MTDEFAKTLEAKSDQINAADLAGNPRTITITSVAVNSKEDQPVSVKIEGDARVYRPSKGMRRLIAAIWGGPENWKGRSLTMYRDPDVRFGAEMMGGIRISHMSHMDGEKKIVIPVSRGKVKTYTVQPLRVQSAPAEPDDALAICEAAAQRGTDAFRSWWTSDEGKSVRATAQENIENLKLIAADADAANMPFDGDGPPV